VTVEGEGLFDPLAASYDEGDGVDEAEVLHPAGEEQLQSLLVQLLSDPDDANEGHDVFPERPDSGQPEPPLKESAGFEKDV
jgi:hypothetical protein